jgi:hypothetical protein
MVWKAAEGTAANALSLKSSRIRLMSSRNAKLWIWKNMTHSILYETVCK